MKIFLLYAAPREISLNSATLIFDKCYNCINNSTENAAVASYVIERISDELFQVDVTALNGTRHRLPGFGTEDEAIQWIKADKQREKWLRSFTLSVSEADQMFSSDI